MMRPVLIALALVAAVAAAAWIVVGRKPGPPPPASPVPAPAPAATAGLLPSAFHGEWNADPAACGTGLSDSRLRLSADRIQFYESSGAISEVTLVGPNEAVVTAELAGEGERWSARHRFRLSPDGRVLTDVSPGGGPPLNRIRCPEGE